MRFDGSFAATLTLLLIAALPGASLSIAHAQTAADPVIGAWQLNVNKSTFNPGPGPKNVTRTYEANGNGVKVTVQGLDALDTKTRYEYSATYDGKDYPVKGTGVPGLAETIALSRIDPLTVTEVLKKNGRPIFFASRTVSKDGKVLTFVTSGVNASGKPTSNMTVYERE
jgi:hypothetical protein